MPVTDTDNGPHYALIKHQLPAWLSNTVPRRAEALQQAALHRLNDWRQAEPGVHAPVKVANAQAWAAQNSVDQRLKGVQDLDAFAVPLLSNALREQYGLDLDVRATYVFLLSDTGRVLKASTSRTLSLLDAALQNFSADAQFSPDSRYISQPDARGHFTPLPHDRRMSLAQFIRLCRELDLGARYQAHLKQHLLEPATLRAEVIASQQAALNMAAHMALLHNEIEPASFHLVQRLLRGERGLMQCYRLRMQDTLLTGIVLIAADLDTATDTVPVLAYIPHDRDGALQPYASTLALRTALIAKLQDPAYRAFFMQFVDQPQRASFFASLQQHPGFGVARIDGDLWPQLYQAALDKILNDGRALAVSTADADRRAHWAWWDSVSDTLESVLNVALLVITPFVPLLGPVMLAYTAYQLLDELVEGVVDLAQGHALEAAAHFTGVVASVVQLGLFDVGGRLVQSVFVNGLKPVMHNGKTRLWNPDPKPYRQPPLQLPAESQPDEHGLHSHDSQLLLPVDGEHYAVKFDAPSGEHRLQHPTRADAYAPPIHPNHSPRAWSDARRLRELGPSGEQAMRISALDHGVLRGIQADQQAAPLLEDTLKRIDLQAQARDLPERLRAGEPVDQDTYWSPYMARELPGWPQHRAILVYETADLSGRYVRFGESDADHTLAISSQDLNRCQLPEKLVDFLDPDELTTVLGTLPETRAARIDALRERIADNFASRHGAVFNYLYRNSEDLTSAHGLLVRQACPGLPQSLVRDVLSHARPAELVLMDSQQHLPLRLKNLAREAQLQARGAHAYQGFYEPQSFGMQTEQMALNTLRFYSDALKDCRLEVRRTAAANVRASAGPAGASRLRVLLKTDGQYQVLDGQQQLLHPATDFFDAVRLALPADKAAALGQTGEALKGWVMDQLLRPDTRRTVLADDPVSRAPTADSQVLVQKPMYPSPHWSSELFPGTLEQRVKALYPYAEQALIDDYLPTLADPQKLALLQAREMEKAALHFDLSNWLNSAPAEESPARTHHRRYLAKALLRTWEENLDPDEAGVHLSLYGVPIAGLLGDLRLRANFDHVRHLSMVEANLLDADLVVLERFPRLLSLDLRTNTLGQLPDAVQHMHGLTHLNLDNNPMHWDADSLGQLGQLRQLQQLSLANQPNMVQAPDIARLPHLESLTLRNTPISQWPDGLFERPRPAHFELDLQNTLIDTVPQFLPWQAEAELVARARLNRNRLNPDAEQRLISYRLEAGLDPHRSYPPRGDSDFWVAYQPPRSQLWLRQLWSELEEEHGSQGFFEVMKSLEPSEFFESDHDAALYLQGREELTDKVWRMQLAMSADDGLRTRLFQMASNPVTCADAGAQTFNAMGIEVQLAEINRDLSGELRVLKLAHLAKGKSRLDRLNKIAQADIRQRLKPVAEGGQGLRFSTDVIDGEPGSVDEVEVYLAYHSGLKHRLQLPWVSSHMSYRVTAGVDPIKLNSAFDNVVRAEAGDGLADAMLEQPFWDRHLRETHAEAFQASLEHAGNVGEPLDDLMFAQNQWAGADAATRLTLQPRLLGLADALQVPHAEVLTGQPMTAQTYERVFNAGFTEAVPSEQQLARRLTQQVLQRLQSYEAIQA